MAELSLTGGCQCGAVRYRVQGTAQYLSHCHCSICRRVHGALFASFAMVAAGQFIIEKGADRLSCYDSSPGSHRYFCAVCGASLYSAADQLPDTCFFAVGTLDGGAHPGHPPDQEAHIYVGSKVPWWRIADHLPQYDELPT